MQNNLFQIKNDYILDFLKSEGINQINNNIFLSLKKQIIVFLKRIIYNSEIFALHKPFKMVNDKCVTESLKAMGIQVCYSNNQFGGEPLHTIKVNGINKYFFHQNSSGSTPYNSFCGGKNNWSQGIEPSITDKLHPICQHQTGGKKTIKKFRLSPKKLIKTAKINTRKKNIFKRKNIDSIIKYNSKLKFTNKAKLLIIKVCEFYLKQIILTVKKKRNYNHLSKNMYLDSKMIDKINLI